MKRWCVSSDWHLDRITQGVERFGEVRDAVKELVDFTIAQQLDAFVFLGDVCDPDAGACTWRISKFLVETARRLERVGIPTLWLAGNHDVIEDGSGDTTLAPLKGLICSDQLVTVVEAPSAFALRNVPFSPSPMVCLPFAATSRAYDPATFIEKNAHCTELVLSHLNVKGCVPGEETYEMPRGKEVYLPELPEGTFVLQGHYHKRQSFKHGGAQVVIPGSLAKLSFSEESHEPGGLLVEWGADGVPQTTGTPTPKKRRGKKVA